MGTKDKSRVELLQELEALKLEKNSLREQLEEELLLRAKEESIFKKLIQVLEEFIQFQGDSPDYNKLLQIILEISGAKYASINIFDDNGLGFTTVALEGINENIIKGLSIIGFEIQNKHWAHDEIRVEKIKDNIITRFNHLHDLAGDVIPIEVCHAFERLFGIGQAFLVKIVKEKKVLGDFTLVFAKGETLINNSLVELYAKLLGLFLDRIKLIDSLKRSEFKHSDMISNISDVIGIIDRDGVIKYTSPNIEKCFGWKVQELLGSDSWVTVHPDDLCRIQKELFKVFENENSSTLVEYRYRCKDGNYKTVDLFATNLTRNPNIEGVLLNYHDITERKKAEVILHESEIKFREIFEANMDGITILSIDPDPHKVAFIDMNENSARMLGYTKEEMFKMHPTSLEKHFSAETMGKRIEDFKLKGFSDFETTFSHKNGQEIVVEITAKVISYNNQPAVMNIVRDISSRKQAELALIEAKVKAEESDRLKSAFLGNMSHEIRTPMNGILGFTELLKAPNLSIEDQQSFIEIIEISGARMLNTINNIVDVSRIESGLVTLDLSETNIIEQLEFIFKFFEKEAKTKGLTLLSNINLASEDVIIKTDKEKIYGILTNLIKNAIKFTSEGTIEFGCEKKGQHLEYYIKDTGVGIPQKQHQAIFDRFRQVDETYNRNFEGSGLGLSISKAYVNMLGGEIWVESQEGIGSSFYFTIPYIPMTMENNLTKKIASEINNKEQLRKLKILIVEDDETSKILLTEMFREHGSLILFAKNAVDAINACKENPELDLILMDIGLPQIDGYEAARQIRKFNRSVIIIAQTAYGFSDDKVEAIESGCNAYISKPFEKASLHSLIEKHVLNREN